MSEKRIEKYNHCICWKLRKQVSTILPILDQQYSRHDYKLKKKVCIHCYFRQNKQKMESTSTESMKNTELLTFTPKV